MAESTTYIVQGRVVSPGIEMPWTDSFGSGHPDLYSAIEFRDKFEDWISGRRPSSKRDEPMIMMAKEILALTNGKLELRIIKRVGADEVIDAAAKVF